MGLGLKYKDSRHIFDERGATVPYLEFPLLRNSGIVNHGFSTRLGGVSEGCFSSMNLSFDRGDRPEAVQENFRRMGSAIGVECGDMVLSQQTHTTNVRLVTEKDRGKGIVRERDYTDVDGPDYRCTGNLSGYILCRLRAAVFCGSGKKGHWPEPFRMARNGGTDWSENH